MKREYVHWKEQNTIAVVTIDRPPVNALNTTLLNELVDTFDELEKEESVLVAVLYGSGGTFIAGADIKEIPALDLESGRQFSELGQKVTSRISAFPRPVIAAIEGSLQQTRWRHLFIEIDF